MRPRSSKQSLIAEPADKPAGDKNLGLRRELDRLESHLADDENWRALCQLDEREARGEPLQAVAGDNLRRALQSRLSSNKFYRARVKIAEALAILDAGSADAESVRAQHELPARVWPGKTAKAEMAIAAPQASPPANAFRTNLKIKPKAPLPDAAPLLQIAADLGPAISVPGSPATAASPLKNSAARAAHDIGLPPVTRDTRLADTLDEAEQLDGAAAQVTSEGNMPVEAPSVQKQADPEQAEPEQAEPEQAKAERAEPKQANPEQTKAARAEPEQTLSVSVQSSFGERDAGDETSAAPRAEEDTSGIAGLRQIAAWRHADVLRARGVDLSGNEDVPATLVPTTLLSARPPAPAQHETTSEPSSPLAQLHWIKGIDADLARQLAALGVGDPGKDGAGDQDAAGVSAARDGFAQISRWRAADVAQISSTLRLGSRASAENWIEQAACLASGRMTRYAMRVAAGETAAVVTAPKQGAAPAGKPQPKQKPKALRKPVCSISVAVAGEAPPEDKPAPSPNGVGAPPSSYTGDFLSQPHRAAPAQPQEIPPVFDLPPRAEMVSAFDLRQSAPRPVDAAKKAALEPESANEAARGSAFVPVPRGEPAAPAPFPSNRSDGVAESSDADPFRNVMDRKLQTDVAVLEGGVGGFEEEAEVVILSRDTAAPAADANRSPQFDETTPAAPARIAAPPPRRENRTESHAAYHAEADEASVVIVSRDPGDEAPDLAFYKQNKQWEREGTIRKFLKALTGD